MWLVMWWWCGATGAMAIQGSGWIEFGADPHPTQLNWVNKKWTRDRSNVRVGFSDMDHWLNGSKLLSDFGSKSQQQRNQNSYNTNQVQKYQIHETETKTREIRQNPHHNHHSFSHHHHIHKISTFFFTNTNCIRLEERFIKMIFKLNFELVIAATATVGPN